LCGNCLLKHVIEVKIGGEIEVTGRQERTHKELLDNLKETRGYWKLKEQAPDRTVWRTGFGRGCGPVVRQTAQLNNFQQVEIWDFYDSGMESVISAFSAIVNNIYTFFRELGYHSRDNTR
jgi:hypothetical protein